MIKKLVVIVAALLATAVVLALMVLAPLAGIVALAFGGVALIIWGATGMRRGRTLLGGVAVACGVSLVVVAAAGAFYEAPADSESTASHGPVVDLTYAWATAPVAQLKLHLAKSGIQATSCGRVEGTVTCHLSGGGVCRWTVSNRGSCSGATMLRRFTVRPNGSLARVA